MGLCHVNPSPCSFPFLSTELWKTMGLCLVFPSQHWLRIFLQAQSWGNHRDLFTISHLSGMTVLCFLVNIFRAIVLYILFFSFWFFQLFKMKEINEFMKFGSFMNGNLILFGSGMAKINVVLFLLLFVCFSNKRVHVKCRENYSKIWRDESVFMQVIFARFN